MGAPVGGVPSLGGEDGAGLLFPLPGGGHLEEAEDLENSVDPDDYSEETTGDVGPSDPNVIQAGSSCQVLVSDFELCKWGPSCATSSPTATTTAPLAHSRAAVKTVPSLRWRRSK